jgi:hypothetical protein
MSGKKNLLNEAQVRKFMKLARLEPLTQGFVDGLTETTETEEELEELRTGRTGALGPKGGGANPGHGRGQGEAANGSLFEEEDPAELEGDIEHDLGDDSLEGDEEALDDEAEIDAEMDVAPEEGGEGRMVSVDDFLSALETALEDAIGDEVEIDSEEMPEEEPGDEEVEMDAEVEMGPEGDEVEMGMEEEPLQEEKEEDLVEQITKRVAARILKSALKK